MARINIEDSIFKEKAFEKLMIKLGSKRLALGALVESFSLAQEYYLKSENHLIPIDAWNREEIGFELIECGFAHVEGEFVRVRGAETQFNWLLKCQKSGKKGGISSGITRRSKGLEGSERVSKGSEPSSSSSSSSSKEVNTKNNTLKALADRKTPSEFNLKCSDFIRTYCESFKAKYNTNPTVTKKGAGIVKNILKSIPLEKAQNLVQIYLQMSDKWFETKGHDLETFYGNIQKITIAAANGFESDDPFRLIRQGESKCLNPSLSMK